MQTLVDVAGCPSWRTPQVRRWCWTTSSPRRCCSGASLGADVVVYSGTKHIDGQGRVLGGAILGDKEYIDGPVKNLMRHTGPALSPFNAWTLLKGLETMPLGSTQHSSAHRIAEFLEQQPEVAWVKYPFLPSHPQYELARQQMDGGGTVITFELAAAEARQAARLRGAEQAAHHRHLQQPGRRQVTGHPPRHHHAPRDGPGGPCRDGLTDGVLRISIGLEGTDDLIADIDQALS